VLGSVDAMIGGVEVEGTATLTGTLGAAAGKVGVIMGGDGDELQDASEKTSMKRASSADLTTSRAGVGVVVPETQCRCSAPVGRRCTSSCGKSLAVGGNMTQRSRTNFSL
jgi:hypothetical protein